MAEITESKNFIHTFIEEDIAEGGRYAGKTVQRVQWMRLCWPAPTPMA